MQQLRNKAIDADHLCHDIIDLISDHLTPIFKFSPWNVERYRPEFELFLKLTVWAPYLTHGRQSVHDKMQDVYLSASDSGGVSLKPAVHRRICHIVVIAILPWILQRLHQFARDSQDEISAFHSNNHNASLSTVARLAGHPAFQRAITALRGILAVSEVMNSLCFLHDGKFRNVSERVLGLRSGILPHSPPQQRSFEILAERLAWTTLSELLFTVVPLLDIDRIQSTSLYVYKYTMARLKNLSHEILKKSRCVSINFLVDSGIYGTLPRIAQQRAVQHMRRMYRERCMSVNTLKAFEEFPASSDYEQLSRGKCNKKMENDDSTLLATTESMSPRTEANDDTKTSNFQARETSSGTETEAQVSRQCAICGRRPPCMPHSVSSCLCCGVAVAVSCYVCTSAVSDFQSGRDPVTKHLEGSLISFSSSCVRCGGTVARHPPIWSSVCDE